MRVLIVHCTLMLAFGWFASVAESQTPKLSDSNKNLEAYRTIEKEASPFVGAWSYRSFRSNPDLDIPPNDLLFGAGNLNLTVPAPDRLAGTLGGDGWSLDLSGGVTDGNPATIRFQGRGTIGGEQWIYDYVGYLVPVWPNGIDQRPAIVGTIVRTAVHSNGQATAGYVAQWIAVKQDAPAVKPFQKGDEANQSSAGKVGLRKRITGEVTKVTPQTPTANLQIGALNLNASRDREWSEVSRASFMKNIPNIWSTYVVADFKRLSQSTIDEITASKVEVLEANNKVIVFHAAGAEAKRLLNSIKECDVVEVLTGAAKLTPEVKQAVAELTAQAQDQKIPQAKNLSGNNKAKLRPIEIAPKEAKTKSIDFQQLPKSKRQAIDVTLYLFQGQTLGQVEEAVKNHGGQVNKSGSDGTIAIVKATLPPESVEKVADVKAVREVALDVKFEKHNDTSFKILVRNPPTYVAPIRGEGQIVGHSDSGLDLGKNDGSLHEAFRGRVKKAIALGRETTGDWSDRGGHGTHTAGTILGCGRFSGVASKAELVHQSLDNENGELAGIPATLGILFDGAYAEGARVHSNSWGVPALDENGNNVRGGVYGDGMQLDSWTWNNGQPRDMLVVFSAGNDGRGGGTTITAPSTGKNCLTIGASENVRLEGGSISDRLDDLAVFSSRGPTKENRIKPDLVAPGTNIVSARTQAESVAWEDDLESATTGSASTDWSMTPGLSIHQNAALNGNNSIRLRQTVGAIFQDILETPSIALPTGHSLNLEFYLRGNASEVDALGIAVRWNGQVYSLDSVGTRNFGRWTHFATSIPSVLQGEEVRFIVLAQETTGLTSNLELFLDQFKITTLGSWGPLSNLNLSTPNDEVDRTYILSGGTSMAAPLSAGCATLVRQSVVSSGTVNPSAELVKAILINSADAHQGTRPNFLSGWGLINLRRAIEGDFIFDDKAVVQNNEVVTYQHTVPVGAKELRVSLVWADAPGAKLVNDLNLKLVSPSGVSFVSKDPFGNSPDKTNNVEGIDRINPEEGVWKVSVATQQLQQGDSQFYSLVISTQN